MQTKNKKELWEDGFSCGSECMRHTDQVLQEFWNETVLKNKMDYFSFKHWERGYRLAKKGRGV